MSKFTWNPKLHRFSNILSEQHTFELHNNSKRSDYYKLITINQSLKTTSLTKYYNLKIADNNIFRKILSEIFCGNAVLTQFRMCMERRVSAPPPPSTGSRHLPGKKLVIVYASFHIVFQYRFSIDKPIAICNTVTISF